MNCSVVQQTRRKKTNSCMGLGVQNIPVVHTVGNCCARVHSCICARSGTVGTTSLMQQEKALLPGISTVAVSARGDLVAPPSITACTHGGGCLHQTRMFMIVSASIPPTSRNRGSCTRSCPFLEHRDRLSSMASRTCALTTPHQHPGVSASGQIPSGLHARIHLSLCWSLANRVNPHQCRILCILGTQCLCPLPAGSASVARPPRTF